MARPRQSGFTLLEVLVALAILAIALITGLKAISQNVNNASYLRDKTLAQWVAQNQLNELRLSGQWPPAEASGTAQMAGHEWNWRMSVEEVAVDDLRRVNIMVSPLETPEQIVVTLPAIVGRSN